MDTVARKRYAPDIATVKVLVSFGVCSIQLHNQQPSIAPEQALKPEIVKAKRPRKKDPLKGLPEFGYWRERNAEQFPLFMEWVKKEKGFLSVDIKLNGLDLWCEYVYLYNRELILQNAGVENESNRLSYNTQSNI